MAARQHCILPILFGLFLHFFSFCNFSASNRSFFDTMISIWFILWFFLLSKLQNEVFFPRSNLNLRLCFWHFVINRFYLSLQRKIKIQKVEHHAGCQSMADKKRSKKKTVFASIAFHEVVGHFAPCICFAFRHCFSLAVPLLVDCIFLKAKDLHRKALPLANNKHELCVHNKRTSKIDWMSKRDWSALLLLLFRHKHSFVVSFSFLLLCKIEYLNTDCRVRAKVNANSPNWNPIFDFENANWKLCSYWILPARGRDKQSSVNYVDTIRSRRLKIQL